MLGPVARFSLASRVLALGIPYVGADFRLDPPELEAFELPSIAVVGTGKRVGKTAVTGHLARLLAADRRVVVVAMGRGGPAEPEVVTVAPTVESLVELSRSGRHAASDHLETAALVGVATVGCRRCGGGLAGGVATSNVAAGARVAVDLDPDLVVFDGSGAALPPIAADRTVAVVGGHQDRRCGGGLPERVPAATRGPRRRDDGRRLAGLGGRQRRDPPASCARTSTSSRLRCGRAPSATCVGASVAYFCAAPPSAHERLRSAPRGRPRRPIVAQISGNLADREALRAELARVDAEVFLVELKAAAIDVVAEAALARGVDVVLAANDVVSLAVDTDLDERLLEMAKFAS